MSSDCLVFRVVEKDQSPQSEDTDIYILYDTHTQRYLLRGKRSDMATTAFLPYSFECYNAKSVADFLKVIIPIEHQCVFELYNYSNLPLDKDDITFDVLRETKSLQNEIVAYNSQKTNSKHILRILSVLVEIANDYEPAENYTSKW